MNHIASMGPRQKSLGNSDSGGRPCYDTGGFNGAEAKKPRKFVSPPWINASLYELQWGRGKKASEILLIVCHCLCLYQSFNGPRQKSLGNGLLAVCIFAHSHASMGPRQKSLGNDIVDMPLNRVEIMLQWGRGKKASEITSTVTGLVPGLLASMGPRQKSLGNRFEIYSI